MSEHERKERIEDVVRNAVDRLSTTFFRDMPDMNVDGFETDEFGTFTVEIHGGRNGDAAAHAPYYFHQLGLLVEQSGLHGVEMWPVKAWFDTPDDVWSFTFGLELKEAASDRRTKAVKTELAK